MARPVWLQTLQPEFAHSMLPNPSVDDVRALKAVGWSRMGVIAAIFDRAGEMLMLKHKGSDKVPEGAFGPMAETSQLARLPWGSVVVESASHTFSRGIREELGLNDPSALELYAKHVGAWALNSWPVGKGQYNNERALAICPVVFIDDESKAMLLDGFRENEEIRAVTFMNPNDVRTSQTRPGTERWLADVMASDLTVVSRAELAPVLLADPQPLPDGRDIKMGQLAFL